MTKKGYKMNAAEMFLTDPDTDPEEEQQTADTGAQIPKGYKLVKESKSQRLQLLIRPTTKAAMQRAADAQGISRNDLINKVLEDYLEKEGLL